MNTLRLKCFLFILLLVVIAENLFCSTLQGKITNFDTDKSIAFVNVFIKSEKIGCQTNDQGIFQLDNINPGSYKITIERAGYNTQHDSLSFISNDYIIEKDYQLKTITVSYNVRLTKKENEYFNHLKESAKGKPIFEFRIDSLAIDSLTYNKKTLFFYSTFTNNTDYPIYILKQNYCIQPFTYEIKDSDGNLIQPNLMNLGCEGFFYNPKLDDLIEILPLSNFNYPKTEFLMYDFNKYQSGKYVINIIYDPKNPLELRYYRLEENNYEEKLSEEISVAKKILSGSYSTSNEIIFEN